MKKQLAALTLLALGLAACQPDMGSTDGTKLWHASFREKVIRGYSQSKWGGASPSVAPDTVLNLSACGNAINPNDLIQDSAGNLLFTSPDLARVHRLAASVVRQTGTVNVSAAQCEVVFNTPTSATGLALDTNGRSFFVATDQGVRYLKYNANTDKYADQDFPIINTAAKISGLHVEGNSLYVVDYKDFNGTPGEVRVYTLLPDRSDEVDLRLTFKPTGSDFLLPEGITIAEGRLWVANNSSDTLMGFALSDINATASGANTTLPFKTLSRGATDSFLHCPGGLATAPNGELWVSVQGASSATASCSSTATPLGNIYKYSKAQLNGADSKPTPALQFSGIASVPGYGGLFFGK
jgi:hypothetical protein